VRSAVFTIAIIVTFLLFAVLRGRLHPVGGLGVALGMTVLLFPVVQPWYELWAVIRSRRGPTRPLVPHHRHRRHAVVGIFGPTANGDRFTVFQILLATAASTVIVAC
jgi:alpha-1,6-mannosyltransferase